MHVQSCLDPQLIHHPLTGEQMYVPCGKCAACLRSRSFRWVQRLDQERYCWKYAVFFTLTYAPEWLPVMENLNGFFVDTHNNLSSEECCVIDINETLHKYADDFRYDLSWCQRIGSLPIVSPYHLQKFIKRLRVKLTRSYDKYIKENGESYKEKYKPNFRYFAIGEYGSTTARPHYHGILFFNSEFEASHISEFISECWKYGITDSSFVSDTNSTYVAQYLNCSSHLPKIYKHCKIRPFFICSKCPPIGTLAPLSQKMQEIFYSASPVFYIFDHSKGIFDNVPLWRTIKDRLFPRLTLFNEITHYERTILYRLTQKEKISNFLVFKDYVLGNLTNKVVSSFIIDYVNYLKQSCDNLDCALQRWYYISSKVCRQSEVFNVSVSDYVRQIEKYYMNCEQLKLKQQYETQENLNSEPNKLKEFVGLDPLYLNMLLDLDISDVSASELHYLSSFGVDVDTFFSDDWFIRREYQKQFIPSETLEFKAFKMDCEIYLKRNEKTRKKNEYLVQHPELLNIIY